MGNLHDNTLEDIIGSKDFDNNRKLCTCPIRKMIDEKKKFD
jgi:hypothetical protein